MPTYDYRCPQCGKFSITQSIKEPALQQCPTCKAPVERLIGRNVNIIYKCGGFYSTDTRGTDTAAAAAGDSATGSKAVNE